MTLVSDLSNQRESLSVELGTKNPNATMAEKVAQAARDFQQKKTGHAPKAVTVVLSNDVLVITLHEALTPAEQTLAKNPDGAAKVQEFHRQLFANSVDQLRQEIKRITGVDVREVAAEVEATTGTVVQVFTSGTVVQVFQLAQGITALTGIGMTEPISVGLLKEEAGDEYGQHWRGASDLSLDQRRWHVLAFCHSAGPWLGNYLRWTSGRCRSERSRVHQFRFP